MDKLLKVESTDIYIFSLILEPFQNLVLYSNYMMSSQQVFLDYGSYISGASGVNVTVTLKEYQFTIKLL